MHIGEYINNYLLENKISQRQFAKRCGLSNGYISMLINNINPKTGRPIIPSLTAMLAISRAMGITIDDLFERVDDMLVDISVAKNLPTAKRSEHLDEYIELFQQLPPQQQTLVISMIKGILSNQ